MAKPALKHNEEPSPFERFQRFTKDLLTVPRKELQGKLDKHERGKAKRRKPR